MCSFVLTEHSVSTYLSFFTLDIIVRNDDVQTMRYPGGKGKTYQHIINIMPPHRVYIESHLGGGAVMRHKKPADRNIGIDSDPKVLKAWSAQKTGDVELVHGRAEEYLKQFHYRGDELVYSDPPYHPDTRRRSRVYRHDYSIEDHERLVTVLRSLPCMVIISGYDNILYRNELAGWHSRNFHAKTHTDVRVETLWFNFEPSKVLHDSGFLGDDFRERQMAKRRMLRLQRKIGGMAPIERAAFATWLHNSYPCG